jgi:hypothetical protein
MKSNNRIPWVRLSAELAVIVVSILAAFTIQAWWDGLQEEKQLRTTLTTLQGAFSESIDTLKDNIETVEADRKFVTDFVTMTVEDAARIAAVDRYPTIVSIYRPFTSAINTDFIGTVLAAEGFESLTNPGLQQAISRWRGETGELNDIRDNLNIAGQRALLSLTRYAEIAQTLALDREDRVDLSEEVMRNARADVEIMSYAATKSANARVHLNILRGVLREAEFIVAAIDEINAE